jgi:hypothetical protein
MSQSLDLKALERRAFRSTFQDGLWDIYIGCLLLINTFIFTFQENEQMPWLKLTMAFVLLAVSYVLFWLGKKYITMPRLGQVRFGPERRKKKFTLGLILAGFVLLTLALVLITAAAGRSPAVGAAMDAWPPEVRSPRLLLASFLGLFLGSIMAVIAYFNDFPRGYYIAVVTSLGFFLTYLLDNPVFLGIAALLIILPGLVLFVRFLRDHPLLPAEASGERI